MAALNCWSRDVRQGFPITHPMPKRQSCYATLLQVHTQYTPTPRHTAFAAAVDRRFSPTLLSICATIITRRIRAGQSAGAPCGSKSRRRTATPRVASHRHYLPFYPPPPLPLPLHHCVPTPRHRTPSSPCPGRTCRVRVLFVLPRLALLYFYCIHLHALALQFRIPSSFLAFASC